MDNLPKNDEKAANREKFSRDIRIKAARKLRARHKKDRGIWFALGMMGLVGWSVALPALLGLALGSWIDSRSPGQISWTLTFLIVGLAFGCLNAWRWISREQKQIEREGEEEKHA